MNISKKIIVPGAIAASTFAAAAGGTILSATVTNAASNNSISTNNTSQSSPPANKPDPSKGGHTANGITETVLTGDTSDKAIAAAKAAEPGATVIRAETDAEGATYEVHMKKSDGSMVTLKLDSSFEVTATQDGFGAPPTSSTTN